MRPSLLTLALITAILGGGCARSKVATEIKADGSWTRTVQLTGQAKKEGMQMGTPLEESFAFPSGAGWKATEKTKESDRIMTFVRTLAAGAPLKGDLTIKEKGGKPILVNEVTVTRSGPRRFEYKETLRYLGEPTKGIGKGMTGEDLAQIKSALPKALATDENAKAFGNRLAALAIPMLFGPGDPLLAIGLVHPDLAERRASQKIGSLMIKALEEQFADKMTPAARRDAARKMIEVTFSSTRPSSPDPAAGPPDSGSSSGLIPMMFILKGPGKLVSSNGEVDELTGEVFWALFPEAAALQPITLTAVWEQ